MYRRCAFVNQSREIKSVKAVMMRRERNLQERKRWDVKPEEALHRKKW